MLHKGVFFCMTMTDLSIFKVIWNRPVLAHKLKMLPVGPANQLKDQFCRFCLFVLRFYGPVNPMGSCRARSVYLTTLLLGRHSPLSG